MDFKCNLLISILMFKKYCLICGMDVKEDTAVKRFGKYFCSNEHAEQYVTRKQEERRAREPRSGMC